MDSFIERLQLSPAQARHFSDLHAQFLGTTLVRIIDEGAGKQRAVLADFSVDTPLMLAGFMFILRDAQGRLTPQYYGNRKRDGGPFPLSWMDEASDQWFLERKPSDRRMALEGEAFIRTLSARRRSQLQLLCEMASGKRPRLVRDDAAYQGAFERLGVSRLAWQLAEELEPPEWGWKANPVGIYNGLIHPDPAILARRLQAARIAPYFARFMTKTPSVLEAVDRAKPLAAALAEALHLRVAVVRHAMRYFAPRNETNVTLELTCLNEIPPERWPSSAADIQAYLEIVEAWAGSDYGYAVCTPQEVGVPARALAWIGERGFGKGHAALQKRLRYSQVDDLCELHKAATLHGRYTDTRRFMHLRLRLAQLSAPQLWQISDTYHQLLQAEFNAELERAAKNAGEEVHWPRLLDKPLWAGRLQVVELSSSSQLYLEGSLMSHCVGTYPYRCLHEDRHILSVRDANQPRPLATLEVIVHPRDYTVQLGQFRGYRNAEPPPAALQAAGAAMFALRKRSVQQNAALVEQRKALVQAIKTRGIRLDDFASGAMQRAILRALPAQLAQLLRKSIVDYPRILIHQREANVALRDLKRRSQPRKRLPAELAEAAQVLAASVQRLRSAANRESRTPYLQMLATSRPHVARLLSERVDRAADEALVFAGTVYRCLTSERENEGGPPRLHRGPAFDDWNAAARQVASAADRIAPMLPVIHSPTHGAEVLYLLSAKVQQLSLVLLHSERSIMKLLTRDLKRGKAAWSTRKTESANDSVQSTTRRIGTDKQAAR